jgi:hypothetical protein
VSKYSRRRALTCSNCANAIVLLHSSMAHKSRRESGWRFELLRGKYALKTYRFNTGTAPPSAPPAAFIPSTSRALILIRSTSTSATSTTSISPLSSRTGAEATQRLLTFARSR